jgi:hypothetical protein
MSRLNDEYRQKALVIKLKARQERLHFSNNSRMVRGRGKQAPRTN